VKHASLALSFVALLSVMAPARSALAVEAPTDCPPGSNGKVKDGFAWCEPSVCLHDGNCAPNEVCRTVPLCVEVGTLADAGGKGEERLVATQRCGAGGACPSTQTCSTKDRCLSRDKAQKLGLLAPAPSASAGPASAPPEAKKSACGCEVAGAPTSSGLGLLAAASGLALVFARRRHRADD
jgi:MYXO-CTERM domain-containing protein